MADLPNTKSDPWQFLNRFTQARIGLGRAGVSLPTQVQLKFNADHALARDAIWVPLDIDAIATELNTANIDSVALHSRVTDRREYLQRPDLGRRLNHEAINTLDALANSQVESSDVALVLIDGLSSTAVQQHGANLLINLHSQIISAGLSVSPAVLVEQGRVAIGDEVGERLNAKSVVVIVGERPGLSSPDSLGIYFTYAPKLGLTDAHRNCISNIRPLGLSVAAASQKCLWLINEALRRKLSGVNLKDNSDSATLDNCSGVSSNNFLLLSEPSSTQQK